MKFEEELESLLNRKCMENESDTPDWILADYLMRCLQTFNYTVNQREKWYGRKCGNGVSITGDTLLDGPCNPPVEGE